MKFYSYEEQLEIFNGISEDGSISKEAEASIKAKIEELRAEGCLRGEIKRRLRDRLNAEQGKAVDAAVARCF